MTLSPDPAPSQDTDALIDHILKRYHEVHRAQLAELQPLARKVEMVHADDARAPIGLAEAFEELSRDLHDHMAKEEMILFPAMRAGGGEGIQFPISVMRSDHDDHAETIGLIRRLTNDFDLPESACGSWRALYAATEVMLDDLAAHISLENDRLFPRFE